MTRLKQPTPGHQAMKRAVVRTVTIQGVTYPEDELVRAARNHVSLVGALKQAEYAIGNFGTSLQLDALRAIEIALAKAKRET